MVLRITTTGRRKSRNRADTQRLAQPANTLPLLLSYLILLYHSISSSILPLSYVAFLLPLPISTSEHLLTQPSPSPLPYHRSETMESTYQRPAGF